MTLHEQLAQAIAKRRAVAMAASTDRNGTTSTGEHWYWGCPLHREMAEATITDVVLLDEHVECTEPDCDAILGWLVSREEYAYPGQSDWDPRPHKALMVEELAPAVGLHITLNDPAFVIRQCERDIKALARHSADSCGADGNGCYEIVELAITYGIEVPK